MADFRTLSEGSEYLTLQHMGYVLKPVASADVPERTIFLNSDSPKIRLCFKDGDGNVFKIRMQAV